MASKLALTVNGKTYFRVSHVSTMLGVRKVTVEKVIGFTIARKLITARVKAGLTQEEVVFIGIVKITKFFRTKNWSRQSY